MQLQGYYKAEYSLKGVGFGSGTRGSRVQFRPRAKFKKKKMKKKGYILSRDSEVTLSHWSRSIELVIMPLINL
jgi:hypothetical protein